MCCFKGRLSSLETFRQAQSPSTTYQKSRSGRGGEATGLLRGRKLKTREGVDRVAALFCPAPCPNPKGPVLF